MFHLLRVQVPCQVFRPFQGPLLRKDSAIPLLLCNSCREDAVVSGGNQNRLHAVNTSAESSPSFVRNA